MKTRIFAAVFSFVAASAVADSPQIEKVSASKSGTTWRFDVTLRHDDTGWDHYADGWGVYTEDGAELGYRVLAHPHVNEQPFTRSLGGVEISGSVKRVVIVPRDSVHGVGQEYPVDLE
ncbi:MAG: hypothetical protein GY952_01945 [Rhodobacteraceae bacterium]|nr:hypothetical protein [Paracoccaceae bacterium]